MFDHGMICITVWLKDVPDPIYRDCQDQECSAGEKVVKKFLPGFHCPIPQGCMYNTCSPVLSSALINFYLHTKIVLIFLS